MVSLSVVVVIDYYLTPALTAIHVLFHLTVKMKIAPMVTKMTGAAIALFSFTSKTKIIFTRVVL